MMMKILFICVFFFEMLIATIFFGTIAEKKKSLSTIIIVGTLIFEIGSAINFFIISTFWLNVLFSIVATFVLSICFFEIKPSKASFYSIVLVAISSFMELIIVFVVSAFSKLYVAEYKSEVVLLTIEIIISKLLYFFIVMILLRFSQKDSDTVKVSTAFYIFPVITLFSLMSFCYISLNQHIEFTNQIIICIVCILLLLATLFVFFSFQSNAQKEKNCCNCNKNRTKSKPILHIITYWKSKTTISEPMLMMQKNISRQ